MPTWEREPPGAAAPCPAPPRTQASNGPRATPRVTPAQLRVLRSIQLGGCGLLPDTTVASLRCLEREGLILPPPGVGEPLRRSGEDRLTAAGRAFLDELDGLGTFPPVDLDELVERQQRAAAGRRRHAPHPLSSTSDDDSSPASRSISVTHKTSVALVDDLDGSAAAETLTFGLEGVTYEIDLSAVHAQTLRDELAPYVAHARRSSRRARSGPATTASSAISLGSETCSAGPSAS